MTKEGPKQLGGIAEDGPRRTDVMEGKSGTPSKAILPVVPNERTNIGRQLWGHGGGAIIEESVTLALNARSWQSGRINEGPPNSVTLSAVTHSKLRKALDGIGTQVATYMINRWTVKMNGVEGYITTEVSQGGGISDDDIPDLV